nr:hypothetical protein KitaXyl93_68240 [Kitasatospora sp. Xyl93]
MDAVGARRGSSGRRPHRFQRQRRCPEGRTGGRVAGAGRVAGWPGPDGWPGGRGRTAGRVAPAGRPAAGAYEFGFTMRCQLVVVVLGLQYQSE